MSAGSVRHRPDRYQTQSSNIHNHHPMSSSKALLPNAMDWEFFFYLGDSQLVSPQRLRSPVNGLILFIYIVLFSWSKKAVLLIKLTVPLEDRVTAGHTRKENRSAALVQQCSENGWFCGLSGLLGLCISILMTLSRIPRDPTSRKLRNECSSVVHRCSYVLFLRRKCTEWTSCQLVNPSALLLLSHAEPSTRPVCCVLFVLCPILPVVQYGPWSAALQPIQAASAPTPQAWFTIYARDGCEAARLRANSSEKVFTKHAGVFTKFSCLRDFATRRADHHGVRPLVYRRIYNTQVYQYGRKQNGAGMQKGRSHWFFVFCPLLCLCFFSFLFFFFSHFLQIPIAAKIIEKLRHMQYLDFKIR